MNDLFNVSEIQFTYKSSFIHKPVIKCSTTAERIFRANWSDTLELVESCYLLLLNRANEVLGIKLISTGGLNSTVVDPKTVFQAALLTNASAIILAHNHPSGNLEASKADISLTKKLKEGSKFLDIQFLDHLILTPQSFTSLADSNLL